MEKKEEGDEECLIIGECLLCEMERGRAEGWGRAKSQLLATSHYLILYLVPSFGHTRKKGREEVSIYNTIHTHTHTHTHTHICICIVLYVCVYVHVCVRVCIVLYTCMIHDAYNCDTLYIYFLVMISH